MTNRIIGDWKVIRELKAIPGDLRSNLVEGVGRATLRLQVAVKRNKLSGQALKVRSGTLRRSVDEVVIEKSDGIVGIVGTNVEYAALHEFGFSGTVSVKEHLRRFRAENRMQLFKSKKPERKFGVWREVRGRHTGKEATVKAHSRRVNLPERSFLRSALRESRAAFIEEMERVAKKVAK